ncbi:hypothetical protein D5R81_07450 [Parashewanella spongiae]|uniref:Uncharacterized protein n=1 Tax=Parashewanella spongiae TaxID=342950 RepID=A0A3A6U1I6_9GAMM|nr:hypothetical protein [Parashewanella spongiae]MCL1079205.1 hypothetical protein [Parashewanella spongiae]RJY17864.1 hypothetical protein D5R81_07450 [Parashewanella spongiae]
MCKQVKAILFCSLLVLVMPKVVGQTWVSNPTDAVKGKGDIVFIANRGHGNIIQCHWQNLRLSECNTVDVSGLSRISRNYNKLSIGFTRDGHQWLYVTMIGSSELFRVLTDENGKINENSTVEKINLRIADGQTSIIDLKRNDFNGVYYFSVATPYHYGSIGICRFDIPEFNGDQCQALPDLHLPVFNFSADGHTLFGVGKRGSELTDFEPIYPITASVNSDGTLTSIQGGTEESTNIEVSSNALSIVYASNKYWLSYRGDPTNGYPKISRFDTFPPTSIVPPESYQAPERDDINLINIDNSILALYFLTLKVGICSADDNLFCNNVFKYLDIRNEVGNEINYINIDNQSHGMLYFRNANYWLLSQLEVNKELSIPDEVRRGFGNTRDSDCFLQRAFQPLGQKDDFCALRYDFRNMTVFHAYEGSSAQGFSINTGFNETTPYKVNINANLQSRTNLATLVYRQHDNFIRTLDIAAGTSGSIEIFNTGLTDSLAAHLRFSFLVYNEDFDRPSTVFQSYFDPNSPCFTTTSLSGGQYCILNYSIPDDAVAGRYVLSTEPFTPFSEDLAVNIHQGPAVAMRFPEDDQNITKLSLAPNAEGDLLFFNVGDQTADNLKVEVDNNIRQFFSGNCLTESDIAPQDSCTLHYRLPSKVLQGNFIVSVIADNLAQDRWPMIIQQPLPPKTPSDGHFLWLVTIDNQTGTLINDSMNLYTGSTGSIAIKNLTAGDITDLHLVLPDDLPDAINLSGSCLTTHHLPQSAGCTLSYQVNSDTHVGRINLGIRYDDNQYHRDLGIIVHPYAMIQGAVGDRILSEQGVTLDPINYKVDLKLYNRSQQDITGVRVSVPDSISEVITDNACTNLETGGHCIVKLAIDKNAPHIGDYAITVQADHMLDNLIPLSLQRGQEDHITIENRGGYAMHVEYEAYFDQNNDWSDCDYDCYHQTKTSTFLNPSSRIINNLHNHDLTFKIHAGKTRTLPSCDGGKIRCSKATLNPHCYYYEGGTKEHPCSELNN